MGGEHRSNTGEKKGGRERGVVSDRSCSAGRDDRKYQLLLLLLLLLLIIINMVTFVKPGTHWTRAVTQIIILLIYISLPPPFRFPPFFFHVFDIISRGESRFENLKSRPTSSFKRLSRIAKKPYRNQTSGVGVLKWGNIYYHQ